MYHKVSREELLYCWQLLYKLQSNSRNIA